MRTDRVPIVRSFLCITLLLLTPLILFGQAPGNAFIRGVDISTTPQIEDAGGVYVLDGVQRDLLDIFKQNGVNFVRLRLWHTPPNGYCGLAKTLAFAQQIKQKGFKFLLDIHYSDTWADPGHQTKPAVWSTISYSALKESVYTYTRDVLAALKNQSTVPDMVQIGNEITAGMLWPDGQVGGSTNPIQSWIQLGELVKQGIQGARDGAVDSALTIMIHIDRGGDNATSRWFFDNLIAQGVQFDIIGLSYYPWWQGTLAQLQNNLADLATRYNRPLVIVETAYPWTTQYVNDGVPNVGVDPTKLLPGYAISSQGQKAFLSAVTNILKHTISGKGAGFFYWEPAYISVPPVGSSWENETTFDFSGRASSTITSFLDFDSIQTIKVTIPINTATDTDTLTSSGYLQVRGEVKGVGSGLLPSGELLTWDSYSRVVPPNAGGDYWQYTLSMYASDTLNYKFWTGFTSVQPTFLRLGWEGPIIPYDGSNINARLFIAGTRDTSLTLQYYSSSGAYVNQYWSPILHQTDSVGILFRVNLADLMKNGLFDPSSQGPLAVRGDSVNSAGVLSWTLDRVRLRQEPGSVANGSFWSGVAYFPKTAITIGTPIQYKFFIERSPFGGTESGINNRSFVFPLNDSTLEWKYFNDRGPVTTVSEQPWSRPVQIRLYPNYPNPFNPATTIVYATSTVTHASLTVCTLLGQAVKTLTNGIIGAGEHAVTWDGSDDAGRQCGSGMYFLWLEAGGTRIARKMMLLR